MNPANNGVGGVVIAGAVISSFRRRGDGARRWSGCVIAVSQRRRFGDNDICRFREPAGGVISWSRRGNASANASAGTSHAFYHATITLALE